MTKQSVLPSVRTSIIAHLPAPRALVCGVRPTPAACRLLLAKRIKSTYTRNRDSAKDPKDYRSLAKVLVIGDSPTHSPEYLTDAGRNRAAYGEVGRNRTQNLHPPICICRHVFLFRNTMNTTLLVRIRPLPAQY